MSERFHRGPAKAPYLLLAAAAFILGWGDPVGKKSREAERSYQEGDFPRAEELFQEARELRPDSPELGYDLGVVMYRQEAWQEAGDMFRESLDRGEGELRPRAYYNLGNCLFQAGDYPGAVAAYRRTLEITPDDMNAKYNLELALRMLEESSSPEPQEGESEEQQSQDQQSEDEQESPQSSPEEEQNQEEQQPENEDSTEEESSPEESPPSEETPEEAQEKASPENQEMSPEDAERILDALRDEETRQMEERRRQAPVEVRVTHDW